MNTQELLHGIEKKVRRLTQHNARLAAENAALESRLFDYLQQLKEAQETIKQLEDRLQQRSLSTQVVNKQALRKELDRYIKIIDQCMAAVNTRE